MFYLFSQCCRRVEKKQDPVRKVTILFMGLENAGKSSVIEVIKKMYPSKTFLSSDVQRTELHLDQFYLTLLELPSGQKAMDNWSLFFAQAHAFVFLVDASGSEHLQKVGRILTSVLKHPRVSGKPLLILANKQDKACAILPSEMIELLLLEKLVNENKTLCRIEPCSVSTDFCSCSNWAVLKGLHWILNSVSQNYTTLNARVLQESLKQTENLYHRTLEKLQNNSDLPKCNAADKEISNLVKYKPFPSGQKRVLKPIQNILTQKSYNLHINKRKAKKARVNKTDSTKNLNTEYIEDHELKVKPRTTSSGTSHNNHILKQRTVIMPETLDNNLKIDKGLKKRKRRERRKQKQKQTQTTDGVYYAGDMGNTFDLYQRAMQALKLKQEQQAKKRLQ